MERNFGDLNPQFPLSSARTREEFRRELEQGITSETTRISLTDNERGTYRNIYRRLYSDKLQNNPNEIRKMVIRFLLELLKKQPDTLDENKNLIYDNLIIPLERILKRNSSSSSSSSHSS